MFSLSSLLRLPSALGGFGRRGGGSTAIEVKPVKVHDVETAAEKRPRTLKHLLRANHANHAVLYHGLHFDNHMAHILGSAFILGASSEQLHHIYDVEAKQLEPWTDAPGEVSAHDWRDFLGRREYQRAFVDFFEDQLVSHGYDWRALLDEYMYGGQSPLVNNLICGLGHPLIHLGYAVELSSHTLAIEALTLAACQHNFLHKYLDDPSRYLRPPKEQPPPDGPTPTPLDVLTRVRADPRFDGLFSSPGSADLETLFHKREEAVLEHWSAWPPPTTTTSTSPTALFAASQRAAVALLVATHGADAKYDFFLVHLLTTSHAVRVLLSHVSPALHVPLMRQWWLLTLGAYVAQLRPEVVPSRIEGYELRGRGWKDVAREAVEGEHRADAHFVKACRAMKEAAETWGDDDEWFLKAAVKFSCEFKGWGGFDSRGYRPL